MIRRKLPGGLSPLAVLTLLRNDASPFALIGDWAAGRAIVGSEPATVASPPQPLAQVLDDGTWPAPRGGCDRGGDASAASAAGPGDGTPRFGGGWVGYLGYGAAGQATPASAPGPPRQLPPWWFGWYDHVLVREPGTGEWFFEALTSHPRQAVLDARYRELVRRLQSATAVAHPYDLGEFEVTPGPQAHLEAVGRAVELIHDGDMFQANITLRLDADFGGDPLDVFCRGAATLQPPYAAFLRLPAGAIASLSPELFLRRTGRQVLTSPIKGTCARSADVATAARQADELMNSAKNRAENVMIVDLMRSDLGSVCEAGSISVPRLAAAEPHPGIWHLVSDVRGELAGGRTDADLVRAAFPPGSVTGAPKVRAMEVIHELEVTPREVYTGAIGYRSLVAGLELNVAIRTFEFTAGRVWLGAGGGIVADSQPAAEYAECLLKSAPLIDAVGGRLRGSGPRASAGAALLALRPRPAAGVFTTLRVTGGVPDGLREHLARLESSTREVFGKDLPAELARQLERCLAAGGSGRLRITVRPVGGPLQCRVELTEAGDGPAAVLLRAAVLPRAAALGGGLGAHKWADRRLLAAEIAAAGLAPDEQLLLTDCDGYVLETDRANVFAVQAGVLRTPATDGRILPGITRARVLAAARQAGLAAEVGPVRLEDLPAASEVFVASSVTGIVPVRALDEPGASWPSGPAAARFREAIRCHPDLVSIPERANSVASQHSPADVALAVRALGGGPLIVLLDNYDSFTYNLAQLLLTAGCRVTVVRNDEMSAAEVINLGGDGLVISPGPCAPAEAAMCVDLVRMAGACLPVLGVCLGHEAIAAAYGANVVRTPPVHGKASMIEHDGLGIFSGLPPAFAAARYHSLLVAEATLPDCLEVSARTADGLPMAIRHRSRPVDGVQFHPESILTGVGQQLMANFLRRVPDRGSR